MTPRRRRVDLVALALRCALAAALLKCGRHKVRCQRRCPHWSISWLNKAKRFSFSTNPVDNQIANTSLFEVIFSLQIDHF
jgi:hypothetical protein